jgi:hypothetical protein
LGALSQCSLLVFVAEPGCEDNREEDQSRVET